MMRHAQPLTSSTLSTQTWDLWSTPPGDAAWNMAVDEALLITRANSQRPILRFYAWTQSCATFGYFQHYSDVASMTSLRPLIRRPTGGGLVPHASDWTYSLLFPSTHPWYSLRAEQSYRQLHEWIQQSLQGLNLGAELAPCCDKQRPGQCFAGPEKFDVVYEGHKIAGAAQRRTQEGLLIQGSVQELPSGLQRSDWEKSVRQSAKSTWGIEWQDWNPDAEFQRCVAQLVKTKYAADVYNQKR